MAAIGIDLGNSNTVVAALKQERIVTIPSIEGSEFDVRVFPSFVARTRDGEILVGEPARLQTPDNLDGTATAFVYKTGTETTLRLHDRTFSPEELVVLLLKKIKNDAEVFLGEDASQVVVSIPEGLDVHQRTALSRTCAQAGLELREWTTHPRAAVLACNLHKQLLPVRRIAVVDVGASRLDISFVEAGNGNIHVIETATDRQAGGRNMDHYIFQHFATQFHTMTRKDIRGNRKRAARVMQAAERAKIDLTGKTHTHIAVPFSTLDDWPYDFETDLSRQKMEQLIHPVLKRCAHATTKAMRRRGIGPENIDHLILIGGLNQMPACAPALKMSFGGLRKR